MWWSDWGRNHVFHIGVDVRQRFLLNRSTCNERWHRGRATRGLLDSICWMVYYRFWFAIWEQPSSFPPLPRKSKHDFGLFGASPSSTSVDNKQMQIVILKEGRNRPTCLFWMQVKTIKWPGRKFEKNANHNLDICYFSIRHRKLTMPTMLDSNVSINESLVSLFWTVVGSFFVSGRTACLADLTSN